MNYEHIRQNDKSAKMLQFSLNFHLRCFAQFMFQNIFELELYFGTCTPLRLTELHMTLCSIQTRQIAYRISVWFLVPLRKAQNQVPNRSIKPKNPYYIFYTNKNVLFVFALFLNVD